MALHSGGRLAAAASVARARQAGRCKIAGEELGLAEAIDAVRSELRRRRTGDGARSPPLSVSWPTPRASPHHTTPIASTPGGYGVKWKGEGQSEAIPPGCTSGGTSSFPSITTCTLILIPGSSFDQPSLQPVVGWRPSGRSDRASTSSTALQAPSSDPRVPPARVGRGRPQGARPPARTAAAASGGPSLYRTPGRIRVPKPWPSSEPQHESRLACSWSPVDESRVRGHIWYRRHLRRL